MTEPAWKSWKRPGMEGWRPRLGVERYRRLMILERGKEGLHQFETLVAEKVAAGMDQWDAYKVAILENPLSGDIEGEDRAVELTGDVLLDWVFRNLHRRGGKLDPIPGPGAIELLEWARMKERNEGEFYKTFMRALCGKVQVRAKKPKEPVQEEEPGSGSRELIEKLDRLIEEGGE